MNNAIFQIQFPYSLLSVPFPHRCFYDFTPLPKMFLTFVNLFRRGGEHLAEMEGAFIIIINTNDRLNFSGETAFDFLPAAGGRSG